MSRAEIEETGLIGAAVRTRPAYDGSAAQIRDEVPVLRYFGDPWFLRTTQDMLEGGVRAEIGTRWHLGLQVAYEPGRETSEAGFLVRHRVPDVQHGSSAGAFVESDGHIGPVPTSLLARVRQDTRIDHGAQADLRLNAGVFRSGPVEAEAFAQTTWLSSRANALLYGISRQEAMATGLPAVQSGSGWSIASTGLLATVSVARRWVVVGTAERHWLTGHDVHGPLAERSGNFAAILGVAHRLP